MFHVRPNAVAWVLALVLGLWATQAGGVPSYNLTVLPTLGGETHAHDINDAGFICGDSFESTAGDYRPFLWDPASPTAIQNLADASGLNVHGALALNKHNDVVLVGGPSPGCYLWTYAGNAISLGDLGGPGTISLGVNNSGCVVGDSSTGTAVHAFRTAPYSSINPATDDIGPSTDDSRAAGINDVGDVCGTARFGSTMGAYRLIGSSTIHPSDIVLPAGALDAHLAAINNNNVCVGFALYPPPAGGFGYTQAIVYDGSFHVLGSLTGTDSSARDINDAGEVVGRWDGGAFYYDGSAMHDLAGLVPNLGGWAFLGAAAINKHGQIAAIVTDGSSNIRACLLTPETFMNPGTGQSVTTGGGATQIGGSSVTLDVTSPGTLTVEYGNDPAGLPAATFGAFGSDPVQYWDIEFTGEFTGSATVTLCYDHTTLTCPEDLLVIQHWDQALPGWVPLTKISQDLVNHTITVVTPSFSPFVIGAPEPATMGLLAIAAVALLTRRRR